MFSLQKNQSVTFTPRESTELRSAFLPIPGKKKFMIKISLLGSSDRGNKFGGERVVNSSCTLSEGIIIGKVITTTSIFIFHWVRHHIMCLGFHFY